MSDGSRYYKDSENLNFPPLTADEELDLFRRVRLKDEEARTIVITRHLLYALKLGQRFCGARLPVDETTSAANVALMNAVDRFDPERGFRFRSFLVPYVRAAIAKCWRARAPVNFKHGAPPTEFSLDEKQDGRSRPLPAELIESPTIEQADHDDFLKGELAACAESLPERERLVIKLHYVDGFNLSDIGKMLKPPLSRERVRQIHAAVLLILKARLEKRGVTKSQ